VTLSGVYSFASRRRLIPEGVNPVRGIEKFRERRRERYLSTEELGRLGEALRVGETEGWPWPEKAGGPRKHGRKPEDRKSLLSKHVGAAFRLLLFTGCRLREILHLRWSEVDFERGFLLLPDSKTDWKPVVLNAPALQVLAEVPRIGGFVILGDDPNKPRADLAKPWKALKRHAGLQGVRIHDLRHTHASIGAGAGLGLPIIGKLLGHKHVETTARYAHLADDPLRRASERIGDEIATALGGKRPRSDNVRLLDR
jgi:integrase